MGRVKAAGLGCQGRDDQTQLVAIHIRQLQDNKATVSFAHLEFVRERIRPPGSTGRAGCSRLSLFSAFCFS
jgi:hypothetical protein